MKCEIEYSKKAIQELIKLPLQIRRKITDKLYFYSQQANPLSYARKLTHSSYGQYRFRIGEYRAIFDVDKRSIITVLSILSVKHRKDVYRGF